MYQIQPTISRIEAYAEAAGIMPETVCRRATNNPRLFDRLKRRAQDLEYDLARIEAYMRDNPVIGVSQ